MGVDLVPAEERGRRDRAGRRVRPTRRARRLRGRVLRPALRTRRRRCRPSRSRSPCSSSTRCPRDGATRRVDVDRHRGRGDPPVRLEPSDLNGQSMPWQDAARLPSPARKGMRMSEEEAIKTAFHDVTQAPVAPTSPTAGGSGSRVRRPAEGVFGGPGRRGRLGRLALNKWDFRGPDALEAAQHVFSNDALGLDGRTGAVRRVPGRRTGLMVDDGTVFNTGRHGPLLGHDERQGPPGVLRARCSSGFDVEVEWIAPRMPHLGVIGPRSREVVQKLTDADVGALRYFRFHPEPVRSAGCAVYLSRTGFGGEMGYELFLTDPRTRPSSGTRVVGGGRHAVRRRGDRDPSHRGRAHRDRLRLRGAPAHARTTSTWTGSSRSTRTSIRRERGAPRRRGRSSEPVRDAQARGRHPSRVRRRR